MRKISIYFLIIFCTIIKAQDDLVLVKLKNGKNVKGIIVQGGEPGDYYVRIKKRNQKTVDMYMKDIKHIYRGTGSLTIQISNEKGDPVDAVIIVQDLDSRNAESVELQDTSYDDFPIGKYRITVEKKGYNSESKRMKVLLGEEYYLAFELTPDEKYFKPVETIVKPIEERSVEYSAPSKTLKKITAVSSLIFGISGAYFEYSASKNYDNYKNAKIDAASYREKVELADDMKLKLFISSGVLMGATGYFHLKEKKIEKDQLNQQIN